MALKKFYFETMTKRGEDISGHLFAENIEVARIKLKQNGVLVMHLMPYEDKPTHEDFKKFKFEVFNKTSEKNHHGEIEAISLFEAYKKLRTKYDFEVKYLVDINASIADISIAKENGIDSELEEKLEEFLKIKKGRVVKEKKEKTDDDKLTVLLNEKQEQMDFLQIEIDDTILRINNLIEKNEKYIKYEKKRKIEEELGRILRLRRSNSIIHLKKIMFNLFDILSEDDLFIPLQDEFAEELEARKIEFKTFSGDIKNKINKGLSKITITIDPEELKASFEKMIPMKSWQSLWKYGRFSFLSISGIIGIFLIIHSFFALFNDSEKSLFFLQSYPLWITLISSLYWNVFIEWQVKYGGNILPKKNLIITGATILGFLLLILEFPVLFFWVKF